MEEVVLRIPDEVGAAFRASGISVDQFCIRRLESAAADLSRLTVAPDSPVLTPRCRRVLLRAEQEAHGLGLSAVDSAQLLIAISAEDAGPVAAILKKYGVTPASVRRSIQGREALGRPSRAVSASNASLTYSAEAMLVLDRSRGQALWAGKSFIGVEHLLLGILACPQSRAAAILQAHKPPLTTLADDLEDAQLSLSIQHDGGASPSLRPVSIDELAALLAYLRTAEAIEVGVAVGSQIISTMRSLNVKAEVRGFDVNSGEERTIAIDGDTVRSVLANVG